MGLKSLYAQQLDKFGIPVAHLQLSLLIFVDYIIGRAEHKLAPCAK